MTPCIAFSAITLHDALAMSRNYSGFKGTRPRLSGRILAPCFLMEAAPRDGDAPGGDARAVLVPNGPEQRGRGQRGQYVYWITFSHPHAEAAERLGLKTPGDFTKETFRQLVVGAPASDEAYSSGQGSSAMR